MNPDKTTLERAFELAKSGKCLSIDELKKRLRAEGYAMMQLEGPSMARQLRALMRSATPG